MTSRREFLKTSALVSAGLLAAPSLFAYDKKYIGLQLYTLRDAMAKSVAGTLSRVAEIGYNSVEATYSDGKYYGTEPKAFAQLLKQNNLIMPSTHYLLGEDAKNQGTLLNGWDKAAEDAASVGQKFMICAWLSPKERGKLDHYKKLADDFNRAGEISKKAGLQFCYHNHDFEFIAENGKYPYDILLENTDKNLVKFEIDLYWLTRAGQDPVALIEKHPGRFPLWHIKDMDRTEKKMFTEVGNGVVNFKRIFEHNKQAGLKYFFVEQDICPGDPFNSITQSISYIKKNLV